MLKDRERLYQIYHTMLSMVLTLAQLLAINHYFELRVPVFLCTVFSLIPSLLIYLFDTNRKNAFSYIILFSIFPILTIVLWMKKANPITGLQDIIQWCNTYNGTEETYIASYAKLLIFCVGLIGSIVFYLLMKKQIAKITLAIVFLILMLILSINKVDINKAVVGICIFYILTIMVEICGIVYSRKSGRQDKRAGILYLAPVCLLLAILAISLSSKPEPIQWKGIKQVYKSVKGQIDTWMIDLEYYFSKSEGEFTINYTGYDEESGELGNGDQLNKDNKVAMRVSGYKGNNPVYLIGSVSDIYTGHSWEKSKLDFLPGENEYLLDYTELIYALVRQDLRILEEQQLIERKSLRVVYNNIKTKTCFYPIKSSWLETKSKKSAPITEYANITFPNAQGKGTTYQIVSYEMNLQNEAFGQMLRDADQFSYRGVPNISDEVYTWLEENILYHDNINSFMEDLASYDMLQKRADMIHTQYTVLPDGLPDRVKKLALKITEDYDTTYDKLKALEGYLNSYTYTLHPGNIPENEDFVDYFLFENKAGYCTSFATAMAILARCVDIPTRYVEGFVVTYKDSVETNMYPVKNSQAHAWAEAYIKGVGWIPFEATAPFYSERYKAWKEKPVASGSSYSDYLNPYEEHRMEELDDMQQVGNVPELEEEKHSVGLLNGIMIFAATVVMVIVIFIIYYSILKHNYKKAFHKANYSRKMYMIFLRILRLLQREGYALEQQETIRMLAQRMKDRTHEEENAFHEVAEIFMRYRYAEAAVTKEEFEQVDTFHIRLSKKYQEERNKIQLWIEEFIYLAKKRYC